MFFNLNLPTQVVDENGLIDFDSLDWSKLRPKGGRFANEKQDEFVYHLLGKHLSNPGFFLDVGCGHPKDGSNTYIFDKYLNWSGFAFDIGDVECDENWSESRTAQFYQVDATSERFTEILKEHVGNRVVDYINVDVDRGGTHIFADVALKRIMDSGIKFKVMTLEHEYFKYGELVTKPTREILNKMGYKILFKDVAFPTGPGRAGFEDWWVNPELLPDKEIMNIGGEGLVYHECVNRVKMFKRKNNEN
jgi:hypothetical protein